MLQQHLDILFVLYFSSIFHQVQPHNSKRHQDGLRILHQRRVLI
ncbi:Protein of unknown function [Pyronema omphalodes CBS 100304]|uniref:Uncharacterized protein n=1 Tax=Pyronema omphalodes (strain CBS 100304) TaxID=1076935 RepID=U4LVQ9_PYROM|nr:Protein of unknown function [Pyronema omphalodes CBS 100304]